MTGPEKVAIAGAHVRRVNPWTSLVTIADDVATVAPAVLAGVHAIVCAVDRDGARLATQRLAHASRVPVVDAGVRADLGTGRTTVCLPDAGAPCLACGWSRDRLARAGEDVGMPCAAVDAVPPHGSTLHMAQATAALAVHQVLALLGVTGETPWAGHELRLDLHAGRLDRFRRTWDPDCAAGHELTADDAAPVVVAPDALTLGDLMAACAAGAETEVVLAASELVASAVCPACGAHVRPFLPAPATVGPCHACGTALAAVRRVRRVRWADAALVVGRIPAAAWFRPGDAFALVDGERARAFAFPPVPLATEPGRRWDAAADTARFTRLPRCYDLDRIRARRLALVGLGHLGAAILEALAPLPWAGLCLIDRDRLEPANIASHALAAEALPC